MKHKILVTIDASYLAYYTLFGASKQWRKTSQHAHILKSPAETDQNNLPDLTKYSDFCSILQKYVMKRMDTIFWILKTNIQSDIDLATDADIFICLDAPLATNWRKAIYPQYKAQRKLSPKEFDTGKCINYIFNVIFKKLDLENVYGCQLIKADHAEGDDLIAILNNHLSDYARKIIIASDKDFLQLENTTMYDLSGKEKTILAKHTHSLTPTQYVIAKALIGDPADNIPKVFEKFGEKKILKIMENMDELKQKLNSNSVYAKQFMLNKQIIDFKNIPQTLIDDVLSKITVKKTLEEQIDLSDLMQL